MGFVGSLGCPNLHLQLPQGFALARAIGEWHAIFESNAHMYTVRSLIIWMCICATIAMIQSLIIWMCICATIAMIQSLLSCSCLYGFIWMLTSSLRMERVSNPLYSYKYFRFQDPGVLINCFERSIAIIRFCFDIFYRIIPDLSRCANNSGIRVWTSFTYCIKISSWFSWKNEVLNTCSHTTEGWWSLIN